MLLPSPLTHTHTHTHTQLRGSEERVAELDKTNKELTDHKYRSEAAIRELKTKLRASEEVQWVYLAWLQTFISL